MSGHVEVSGFASGGAGASAHGGLLGDSRDAGLRCGISSRARISSSAEIVQFLAFMAQAGRMVVCGDAGDGLGDLPVRGPVIYVRARFALSEPTHV